MMNNKDRKSARRDAIANAFLMSRGRLLRPAELQAIHRYVGERASSKTLWIGELDQ